MAARLLQRAARPGTAAAAAPPPPPRLLLLLSSRQQPERALSTEMGEMAALYSAASDGPRHSRGRRARTRARERPVPAAQRLACSDVLDMASERLRALGGELGALDGRWFFDVFHALKYGSYPSPVSRSVGLQELLAAAAASLEHHPEAWGTHELSATAAALAGFAQRGLLSRQQRRLFAPDGAAAAALRALARTFGARFVRAQVGPVQVTNMLWALTRAGLTDHELFGRAAAWLAAAEARDDCLAAARAGDSDPRGEERPQLAARLAAACDACDAMRAPRPALLFAKHLAPPPPPRPPVWADGGLFGLRPPVWAPAAGDEHPAAPDDTADAPPLLPRQLAPGGGYVSVLRSTGCEVPHLVLLLWALTQALAAARHSGSVAGGSGGGDAPARRDARPGASGDREATLQAACAAILRRLLAVADDTSLFSGWHVAAVSAALRELAPSLVEAAGGSPASRGPSATPATPPRVLAVRGASPVNPPPQSIAPLDRHAIWAAVSHATGATQALNLAVAAAASGVPAAEQPSGAAPAASFSEGDSPSRDFLDPWADISEEGEEQFGSESKAAGEADAAEGGGSHPRRPRHRHGQQLALDRVPPPVLSARALALQPLPHVLHVAWAAVASWSAVLLPLLQPRQLATILDGLSHAAASPAAADGEWPCAFPREAVLHALLHRTNAHLKERGRVAGGGGVDGEQYASVFKPSEVGAVASAVLRFTRSLAVAPRVSGGQASPWRLEAWVPLSYLAQPRLLVPAAVATPSAGHPPLVAALASGGGCAQPPPQHPASSSPALDAALALEFSTLLTLAGDVTLANLHADRLLKLTTASQLIAASVGLAGNVDAGALAGHLDAPRVGGMSRGQLVALAAHVARSLDSGGRGKVAGGRYDEEPSPAAPGAAAQIVSRDEQLDALWALAAAAVPRPAAGAQAPHAGSARAALVALCKTHALGDMTLRQLATLSAAAALSVDPLPSAAVAALLPAVSARLRAQADAGAVVTLAWAIPFVLASCGGVSGSSPVALGEALLLLRSLSEALQSVGAGAAGAAATSAGDVPPSAPSDALRPHWDVLAATVEAVTALLHGGAPHGAPSAMAAPDAAVTVAPPFTRLRSVLAAHARWDDAVRRVLGRRPIVAMTSSLSPVAPVVRSAANTSRSSSSAPVASSGSGGDGGSSSSGGGGSGSSCQVATAMPPPPTQQRLAVKQAAAAAAPPRPHQTCELQVLPAAQHPDAHEANAHVAAGAATLTLESPGHRSWYATRLWRLLDNGHGVKPEQAASDALLAMQRARAGAAVATAAAAAAAAAASGTPAALTPALTPTSPAAGAAAATASNMLPAVVPASGSSLGVTGGGAGSGAQWGPGGAVSEDDAVVAPPAAVRPPARTAQQARDLERTLEAARALTLATRASESSLNQLEPKGGAQLVSKVGAVAPAPAAAAAAALATASVRTPGGDAAGDAPRAKRAHVNQTLAVKQAAAAAAPPRPHQTCELQVLPAAQHADAREANAHVAAGAATVGHAHQSVVVRDRHVGTAVAPAPVPGRSSLGVAVGGPQVGTLEQQNNPTCVVVRRINGAFMGGRLIGVCLNAINAAAGPIVTQQTSQNSSYAVFTLASPEAAAVVRGIDMDAEAVKAGVPATGLLVTAYCTDLRTVAVRRVDGGPISAEHVKKLSNAVAVSGHDRWQLCQMSRDGITLFLTLLSGAGAGRALSSDINVSLHPDLPRCVVFAARPDPRELTPSSNVLVLSNLGHTVTREQLTMFIRRVTAIPVLEVTPVSRSGVSFATFASIEDAGNAVQTLHMASHEGCSIHARYRRPGDLAHMPPNKGGGGGAAGAGGSLGGDGVISGPAASCGHVVPGVSAGAASERIAMVYAGVGVRQVGGGGGAFMEECTQ